MPEGFTYHRRREGRTISTSQLGELMDNWSGQDERWMFVAPHDDDVVIGAGLLLIAALQNGVTAHAVITTDGRMGYCTPEERYTISDVRRRETENSFRELGLPNENVHFLGFPDCGVGDYCGRREAREGEAGALQGYTGLQNSYTYMLRQIQPTRVFLPTITDLHPDHQHANREMLISIFHSEGLIWPELGEPIKFTPEVFEYAAYCDFPETPQIKVETDQDTLKKKLRGIEAYESQKQIYALVENVRQAGPVEYFRKVRFNLYSALNYKDVF